MGMNASWRSRQEAAAARELARGATDLRVRPVLPSSIPPAVDAELAVRPRRPVDGSSLRFCFRLVVVATDIVALVVGAALVGAVGVSTLVVAGLLLLLHGHRQCHTGRLVLSVLDDAPALLGRSVAATGLTVALGVLFAAPNLADPRLFLVLLLQVPLMLVLRSGTYSVVLSLRRRRVIEHPTLVLGAGLVAGQLISLLLAHPEYGLRPVGMIDDDPLLAEEDRPVPLLGGIAAMSSAIVEFQVRNVVVAFGGTPASSLLEVLRTCDRLHCQVFSVPRLFEVQGATDETETVWGMPLVRIRRAPFHRTGWKFKRALDIVVSAAALLLLSPLLAVLALSVRLDMGKGVLFRQTRIGLRGKEFELIKFRSLCPSSVSESDSTWSVANDARLGTYGKILRASSLDELPQLWNIFRGDMTLVGPRPERPGFAAGFSQADNRYSGRDRVPAGLTGWAQVNGLRGDTSIKDRARFDNFYIENWTFWGDVKIVLRTLLAPLKRGRG